MPLNGGIVLPQDVHVKPFTSEIRLNASLDTPGSLVRRWDLMAFQEAIPTSTVATQA
jgi:hypothetical protein